jgi:V/A-type H+-transporting ATPase subunit A
VRGRIKGISGPTVIVEMKGLRLYDRVHVGDDMLTGEVVRLERGSAVVQVYENTKGLGVNEPVAAVGNPLTVRLGPGLLAGMFDGLQRPIERLREDMGPFIISGKEIYAIDCRKTWKFFPLKEAGETVSHGETIGYVEEGPFRHDITSSAEGKVSRIIRGDFRMKEAVAEIGDGIEVYGSHEWPVRLPRPFRRKLSPAEPLITGQRCIDFLFTLARGGTAILPGGFGTGKTVLEQSIAKFADVDIVVYVGCGERGNEISELIEDFSQLADVRTGKGLMERTILVVNTSNMPVAAREASIYTAVTMAEYFRDMGCHVLLLADSLSRWAEALREISSSLEETPGEEGYPTYLSSRLSGFFERAGAVETLKGEKGSLSMILSVSPPGGDFTEPVTQACMRAAGAFLMLDTSLAHRRHFPAINWFQSYSLYGEELSHYFRGQISNRWDELKQWCREMLQREEKLREVSEIVGHEGLQDADRLLMRATEKIRLEFLNQNTYSEDAYTAPEETVKLISEIKEFYDHASEGLRQGRVLDEIMRTKGQ